MTTAKYEVFFLEGGRVGWGGVEWGGYNMKTVI